MDPGCLTARAVRSVTYTADWQLREIGPDPEQPCPCKSAPPHGLLRSFIITKALRVPGSWGRFLPERTMCGTDVGPTGEDAPLLECRQSRNYSIGAWGGSFRTSYRIRLFPLWDVFMPTRRTRESNSDTKGIEPVAHTSGYRSHGRGVHGE